MKTKNYEAPETEVVVVRIERQIMSQVYGSPKQAGAKFSQDRINDYDDDF